MLRSALLVTAFVAAAFAALAQSPDPHYICDRTGAIARKSAFVHGYLHGYEQGFHVADLDIQLGRTARDISKTKEVKPSDGYRREFGDKHAFEHGYRQGVRVGYADGISGRTFRALKQLEPLHPAPADANVSADAIFDRGFSMGYMSGQTQGLMDGRREVSFNPPLPECPPPGKGVEAQSFCSAYIGGYRVGYSDGFINVARPPAIQVEARAGK